MVDIKVDTAKMPLGQISVSQLTKGFGILDDLQKLVQKKKKSSKDSSDIVDLSGKFYQVIPHSFPRHIVPPAINSEDLLEEKLNMLNTLKDIEVAQSVMNVGNVLSMPEHPLDTKYRELAADLEAIDPINPIHALISNYVTNTIGNQKIQLQDVWSVRRHTDDATFAPFNGVDNHRLLWHGTNVAVVAAILKTGLRIMPTVNGGRVGRGIYLADEIGKSSSYVRTTRLADGTNLGILFLVQAALGKMHVIYRDDGSLVTAPPGFHSVLAKGTQNPDPKVVVPVSIDGNHVVVPQGTVLRDPTISSSFSQNEFVVYDQAQQRLRYVLTFKF